MLTVTVDYVKDGAGFEENVEAFRTEALRMMNDDQDLAADQETVISLPPIRRGEKVSSYYQTSGQFLFN